MNFESLLELPFVRPNEPLAKHTTMKVGGPAQIWAQPNDEEELQIFLERQAKIGAPLYVLGAGSNIVASERGFEGIVLNLGRGFAWMRAQNEFLSAGGAAMLPKMTKFALENQLGNFEWACGIPGTLGGSLWGNAGARGFNGEQWETRDCAADFHACVAFSRDGKRRELGNSDVEFRYRGSNLGEFIVTQATFSLRPLSPEQAKIHKAQVRLLLEKRRATQPANAASAGCIWKNPKGQTELGAGALIEKLGLKGQKIGGAQVSEIHGNFVINAGGASAREVLELVEMVEKRAREEMGISLEREARFI